MAYETGSATDLSDLIDKLHTFAIANGWTEDEKNHTTRKYAIHKNSIYISYRVHTTGLNHMSLHQALGFTGGNRPGTHPDDSGNGWNTNDSPTDTNLAQGRHVDALGNGTFSSYHFFENDSSPAYLHVVVQVASGVYRHFIFGEMEKFGTFTGGEYCCGHSWNKAATPSLSVNHSVLWDGLHNQSGVSSGEAERNGTIHLEGLPGQPAGSKWGAMWAPVFGVAGTNLPPTDTAGNAKVPLLCNTRNGPIASEFGWINSDSGTGLVPAYPIWAFYVRDNPTTTLDYGALVYPLGCLPDVRGVSIKDLTAEQELSIGSDTWVVFPMSVKGGAAGNNSSNDQGIMYKKVTA